MSEKKFKCNTPSDYILSRHTWIRFVAGPVIEDDENIQNYYCLFRLLDMSIFTQRI